MRVSELYEQVSQLGFEEILENDERFIFSVNRALYQVNLLRPRISYLDIAHFPLANLVANPTFEATLCTGEVCYVAEGAKAVYFEVKGEGIAYVEDSSGNILDSISFFSLGTYGMYRALLPADAEGVIRLRFVSNYVYTLRNVAMYGALLGADSDAIPPFKPYVSYDISQLAGDFLGFSSPPVVEHDKYAKLTGSYQIEGDFLLLAYDKPGSYRVAYKHKPSPVIYEDAPANNESELDLDEELCTLLPLLVASYMWLEDEPERAMYYKTLYNERASELNAARRDCTPSEVININGW
ncbi:MAG: hypothetical protein IJW48_04830 [Clostridia bacterium]|nr:hypothetical protein [Clostridia bacterium]